MKHYKSKGRNIQRELDLEKFKSDLNKYVSMCDEDEKFPVQKEFLYPIVDEYKKEATILDPHYFLQDIWFANKIIKADPPIHYDIGSSVSGFVAHLLAAGLRVNLIDIRPLSINMEGLFFTQGDATDLSNIPANSIYSLSSLHVVEHFGLGRYGDTVDPKGWIKGLKAMQRIVGVGGYFYLSFPTGSRNTLCFNAHRIFEFHEAAKVLDEMELIEAAYISNYKVYPVPLHEYDNVRITSEYSCAMYIFRKRGPGIKTELGSV